MQPTLIKIACLILIFASACGTLPGAAVMPVSVPGTPDFTPTRTPFQPEPLFSETPIPTLALPSATPEPSQTVTPVFPTPTLPIARVYPTLQTTPASTQTPAPADLILKPDGQVSVLLLGSDQHTGTINDRTDVIILMNVKPDGSISLISIPRDLYVFIPGFRMSRINAAYVWGGFDLLAMTFEYNFGILPDYFVLVKLEGFKTIVDSLGGIDVYVSQTLHDERDDYPDHSDAYPNGFTVNPGMLHMDGATALWYSRSRKTTSDLDRIRRSQDVLIAIGKKLFSMNAINHIPELYITYQQTVVTNLGLNDLLGFTPLLFKIDPDRVERYTITLDQVIPWKEPISTAQYLLPKPEAIRQLFLQAVGTQ